MLKRKLASIQPVAIKDVLLVFLIFSISILFFAQNWIKYGSNEGYEWLRSFLFNLITLGSYGLWVPLIKQVTSLTGSQSITKKLPVHFVSLLATLVIHALVISFVLYGLQFLSAPFHSGFLVKYATNMALFHVLVYVITVLLFAQRADQESRFLSVTHGKKKVQIRISDIQLLESSDHYVKIFTDTHMYVKKISMKSAMSLLGKSDFMRVHRRYIINKSALKSIEHSSEHSYVQLNNGKSVRIGSTYLTHFKKDPVFAYA